MRNPNSFFVRHKEGLIDLAVLLLSFLFIIASFLVFKRLYRVQSDGLFARIFTYSCIVIWLGVLLIDRFRNKLTFQRFLFYLFILSVIVRVAYMLITPYNYRQHDTNYDEGHQGYAWIIYTTGQLPTTNAGQYYHPPFNAAIQAGWMHFAEILYKIPNSILANAYDVSNSNVLYESTQMLSCFYTTLISFLTFKTINKLELTKFAKIFAIVFIAFFPSLILFSATENNDTLCLLFCFATLYFTFEYLRNKTWKNLIFIGLSIGLAMAAKLSGGLVALVPGVLFVIELIKSIKSKEMLEYSDNPKKKVWKKELLQYIVVIFIAAAIGLWFSVYALARFNQPIGYVWPLSKDSPQYHGDMPIFDRLINIFDFKDLFAKLYGDTSLNYNLWNFTVKTSLFGEFNFQRGDALAYTSIALNYGFILLTLIVYIIYLITSKFDKKFILANVAIITLLLTQYGGQIIFNIKYPFGCTMDFRYIVPIIFAFGLIGALVINNFSRRNKFLKALACLVLASGIGLIALTNIFYLIVI